MTDETVLPDDAPPSDADTYDPPEELAAPASDNETPDEADEEPEEEGDA